MFYANGAMLGRILILPSEPPFMNHDTLRQVMPVVVSIVVIIAVAMVRSYSKTLAAITATMPVNIPLAMWIVYSGENGDHDTVAQFAGSLFAGLGATILFTVVLWLAARAGLGLVPMPVVSYLAWGGVLVAAYCPKTNPRGNPALRSLTIVVSDDASQHLAVADGSLSGNRDHAQRAVLFETLMGATGIVVGHILVQRPAQMVFVENDQLIQALLADRSNPPFGVGIGIRSTVGDINDLHPFRLKHRVKRVGELGVVIVDQIADG
jgi:hypothetical protein